MAPSALPISNIDEVTSDGRGRRHRWTHQVRSTTLALTALEITIRGAGAALARLQDVGVHAQAHAAARLPPLEARFGKDAIEALLLGSDLDLVRTRHHHRAHARMHPFATHDLSGRAQVLDASVGARADEDPIEVDVLD